MVFGDILKGVGSEGKEKHVPVIEAGEHGGVDMVHVITGKETPHPNTTEHHIAWVELYGQKKDGQVINLGRTAFAPGYTSPGSWFQVPVAEFKAFCALSYCNIHGLWANCLEI
ncbi:class II SORL domain-containing protein [Chloroflexota bacterium]